MPTVIWMVVIFQLSSQEGIQSASVSRKVTEYAAKVLHSTVLQDQEYEVIVEVLHPAVRKTAHMAEYAILYVLLFLSFFFSMLATRSAALSIIIAFIYAIIDETHQTYVSGRSGQFYDVCVDMTGVLIAVCIAHPMNRESMRNSAARQQAIEDLTGAVIEYTEGLGVSKSFCMTGESAAELRRSFAKSRDANLTFERQHTPWERALQILYTVGTAAILALAVWLNGQGALDAAGFVGVLPFLLNIFAPIKHLFQLDSRLTIMENCLDRLDAVFAEKPLSPDGSAALPETAEHEIEFDRVRFAYGKETILHDISFTADRGQMIALVGESGSGKTTIANLLARFWDVQEGTVRLRGVDIRKLPMETLMAQISMVFQKVYLFEDTIKNNIAMGRPDASFEEIVEAAKKARCYDFIMRLPYGFDNITGEGGASLSGGEAQRISIARCILKDAPIIILDEATASVDADNEVYIQQAMSELCRNKTVLVIAHRLNTVRGADCILVLEKGRIVEQGSHDELMAKNGAYCHMIGLQERMSSWNQGSEPAV